MKRLMLLIAVLLATITLTWAGDTCEKCKCVHKRIQAELRYNPAYIWGAAGLAPGAPGDCSGKLYAILFS